MRRIAITVLAFSFSVGVTVVPRTDGSARTNEGYPVRVLNPASPLPAGWTWD